MKAKNRRNKKTILVTGGSRGIGAATVSLAATHGYNVCFNYHRNRAAAQNLAEKIETSGGKAITFSGNISCEAEVIRWFGVIDEEFGSIDALVNNAGILERKARTDEMCLDRWKRVFVVNTFGTFLCSREAVRRMSSRYGGKGGAIVNVSSKAATLGGAFEFVDYGASKGAIDTMTLGMAKEVATEGIRINGVRPGLIDTEIHANVGVPNRVKQLQVNVPMGRGGTAEEVANVILWLLSDAASYVTGTIIDVSGGR